MSVAGELALYDNEMAEGYSPPTHAVANVVAIPGRPPLRRRNFHVQYSRKPFRCQPMTVSGFTITSISRRFGKSRDRGTQSSRSDGRSEGRRELLFIVAS